MQILLQKTLIHSLYMGLTFLRRAAEQSLERTIEVIEGGAALLDLEGAPWRRLAARRSISARARR